ncbi:MAG: hypothetical protein WD011_03385 [Nitriliruptoraceae bacterium]
MPSRAGADHTPAIAAAMIDAAARYGHAPAVTVRSATHRSEQSYAGLAQWVAKGAHLLESLVDENSVVIGNGDATPGPRVGLDAPPSWIAASAALATWWIGGTITLGGPAPIMIRDEHRARSSDANAAVFCVGAAIDGGPTGTCDGESWPQTVQPFPDNPPPPQFLRTALRAETDHTPDDLLAIAADQGTGRAALRAGSTDAVTALVAVALRPLVIGRSTVVLDGVDDSAADEERVTTWIEGARRPGGRAEH